MIRRSLALQSKPNKITVRIVSINDVYELHNLPRLSTLLQTLTGPKPSAVVLAGDFLSPSTLSSIDGGRGMASTLRASGITHASLGNHEADLKLTVLRDRVHQMGKLSSSKKYKRPITVLNSNVIPTKEQIEKNPKKYSFMVETMKPYDIVTSYCGKIKVGLMGLLSDEEDMFRDGTFKGVPIEKVTQKWDAVKQQINSDHECGVHALIPMTHQSLLNDRIFARHILRTGTGKNHLHQKQNQPAVIIGGHEHEPYLEIVRSGRSRMSNFLQIVKTGQDADRAAIIDLIFSEKESKSGKSTSRKQLEKINVNFVELADYEEAEQVKFHVHKHMKVLKDMDSTNMIEPSLLSHVFSSGPWRDNDFELSSKRTRFQQTSVGALFCQMIKCEFEVDACIINGAPIKGDSYYSDGTMSYSQLKSELPFPLKMVVVNMTRGTLEKSIRYSRTSIDHVRLPSGKDTNGFSDFQYDDIERRGYLQTDYDYMMEDNDDIIRDRNEVLSVALPRNLMNGFCNIKPLMELGDQLKARNQFPSSDDFMKAIDIIVRYCCKERWVSLFTASQKCWSDDDLDIIADGPLEREHIKKLLTNVMETEPSDFLVDDMMNALDEDENGVIDDCELQKIIDAARERMDDEKERFA